jgi:hypothetical protein
MKKINKLLHSFAIAGLLGCAAAHGDNITVSNDVTSATTWLSSNTYYLQRIVYVQSNAVLTIEPGTVIKAMTTNLISSPGVPIDCSALWVCRGGKLYATGSVTSPIIFTYDGDDVNDPNDVPYNTMGKWGGVVLLGNATINSAQNATGNTATPKFEVFEGTTDGLANEKHIFGGSDDTDNSGALSYVSIRYPGIVFAPAKELNGLTMGGVGSGTSIEYIEVFNSADDAFEWWGGTVSTKHLVAAFCDDDDFDTDQGYRGTNQFWFGIKPTWTGSSDSRGFETDGDLNQGGYPGSNAVPTSTWVVHNVTEIGRGTNVSGFGGGVGWNARDEARPNVYNSVFTEFASGVKVDVDGTNEFFTGVADLRNTVFHVVNGTSDANANYLFTDAARTNTIENPLLNGISYTNNAGLNPRPQAGSPLLGNVAPQGAGLETTTYRGAFNTNDTWHLTWTAMSQLGIVGTNSVVLPPPAAPTISSTFGSGTVTFSIASQSGYNYALQSTPALNPPAWTNIATLPGNGGVLNFPSVATTNATEFFRVLAQ